MTTTAPIPATPVAPLFRPAPVSGVGPDVDLLLALAGLSSAPAPSAAEVALELLVSFG